MDERRYQVFVSSTFLDLRDERSEVFQALLELGCIPAGMEMFPASNATQWELIKKVIADCDYYVVIVGNRYGSVDEDGISYTEKEYDFAVEIGLPVLGFLHESPGEIASGKSERDASAMARLEGFREKVGSRMCKMWRTAEDLGGKVSRSLIVAMRAMDRPGWVRGGGAGDPAVVERLRKKVDDLEAELEEVRTRPPSGSERLAQGQDEFRIRFTYGTFAFQRPGEGMMTWDHIFRGVGPVVMGDTSEQDIRMALGAYAKAQLPVDGERVWINEDDFQTIKVQLEALGLICLSDRKKSVSDTKVYWQITPYGRSVLTKLRAIERS